MAHKRRIMGVFQDETQAAHTVKAMADAPWRIESVHSPIPSTRLAKAAGTQTSKVGYFTLVGGIIGFISGFTLAAFTASRWELIVSGKPVMAWIPFVIVGFEFTILVAVLGNVIGLMTQARIPDWKPLTHYDARCSGDHYGVLASCKPEDEDDLIRFIQSNGGEARVYET
ncbi:MAG: DUF3341 domain-containing protein [Deltaproteobacteria bacterium]|nr:DUF3341 domain-containing protein [Deltaproteobacteria bacterium]